ncbi:type VII secretion protein EssC [Priestia taiwanensis]|nr:type VII secretion protein EssC [Priestia taiwanensis]MBM7361574.1 S-DNA-T family DNA segregation ATPase FtsK/SpoIIIE [Priestia taiwanensis]
MSKEMLMIRYEDQLYKLDLHYNDSKSIIIGNNITHTITIKDLVEPVELKWEQASESWLIDGERLPKNQLLTRVLTNGKKLGIHLVSIEKTAVYDTTTKYAITISHHAYDDIFIDRSTVDALLMREALTDSFTLHVNSGEVYHNYRLVRGEVVVDKGDILIVDGIIFTLKERELSIQSQEKNVTTTLPALAKSDEYYSESYPDYHRSPRIIHREPTDKMTIAKPPNMPSKANEQLVRTIVPPIVMILVTIFIALIYPVGFYIIASVSVTLVTIVISITTYFNNVKEYKQNIIERDNSYREYLKNKTMDLYKEVEKQRHALAYHYPEMQGVRDMAVTINPRIYEKTRLHHDFLMYRVGSGTVDTSFDIAFNEEEFSQQKDELIEEARKLKNQFLSLHDVPITTSLMKGPVGYIGQRSIVIKQLQWLVMQTALFHSYHDVQFITIFPEEEKKKWDWMRWLPHASVRDINVRGFVYHARSRDQVLNSLYQILKERRMALEEKGNSKEKLYFSPHYVVLITDEKLILDHIVMEFFNEDPSELGVSLVFVQDVMQSLPEHVKTVIDIRDSKSGNIILEEGELVNTKFSLDGFPMEMNKEDISRALAPLNHLQNLKNSIPESVTFLELYGVEKVEELGVGNRWSKNATHKTLAVPLGLRGKEDIVNLNLHEKAHGPHGLIAGTTGSGKSEIIQSYILSLAVNFHPHEVAFLLIDYKGGGMANLFKNLPHLLGAITNLDGAQSMRALASIKAELKKRQRLFGEYDVNHINQYHKLYKEGKVQEAMPHLFLISDEFAELKAEQPDFMKELVSTARIGRSLGIHLILATQKPSGVVDDQIWSNSKFKLALKVQNASDSNEILKTPDAAEIKLPGRAYLQVGNNEIYELFQSAWSGADYVEDKDEKSHLDATIYAINELGQYEIISEDLSGLEYKKDVTSVPTELDAVIDYIHDYAESNEITPLPRPWLPPLPEKLFLPQLHPINFNEAWKQEKRPLQATIGLLDQPELQAQTPLTIDMTKDGHVAVYSSPGYGKSTFLQTVIMDLARQHCPEHLHIYLLDFGTNGLLPLKALPHVADTITIDEAEKCLKLVERLGQEMKRRKKILSDYDVANMSVYEKASGKTEPNIIITIDNYDSVKEAPFYEAFDLMMMQVVREGASLGIHVLLSASRQNALRIQLHSNIKIQTCLYMIDNTETVSIVGRSDIKLEELEGRALIKLENSTLFQTALPTIAEDELLQIQTLQQEAIEMDNNWDGERPKEIPMMPEVVELRTYRAKRTLAKVLSQGYIPIGLDFKDVEIVAHDASSYDHLMIYGVDDSLRQQVISSLIAQLDVQYVESITLVDTPSYTFIPFKEKVTNYIVEEHEVKVHIGKWLSLIQERTQKLTECRQTGKEAPAFSTHIVFIADVEAFNKVILLDDQETSILIDASRTVGVFFIFAGHHDYINRNREAMTLKIKTKLTSSIVTMPLNDQTIFSVKYISNEQPLGKDEVYYYVKGQIIKVKMPRVRSEVPV